MNNSWQLAWEITLRILPFLIGLSGVALQVQLACSRHYPTIIKSLERSLALERLKFMWGEHGFYSRLSLVSSIAALAFCPQHFIKRKLLHPDDIKRLPHAIKKRLCISIWLLLMGALGLTASHFTSS
ncbi:hypothetical protein [Pseudomonas sp. NPDC089406]|uniref:hypothetical protein n=1 Tax=Pseudomonas sp. NPDC089406 TaxID=3364463 RepID=UPI00384F42B9